MGKQIADCNVLPGLRGSVYVVADPVIQIDPTFLNEEEDRGRRKLFCDLANLKDGLRRSRDPELKVGVSIPFEFDEFAVFEHRKGEARKVLLLHSDLDVIIHLIATHQRRAKKGREN